MSLARWIERGGKEVRAGRTTEFHVCAAPIGGGERLRTLLWDRAVSDRRIPATTESA